MSQGPGGLSLASWHHRRRSADSVFAYLYIFSTPDSVFFGIHCSDSYVCFLQWLYLLFAPSIALFAPLMALSAPLGSSDSFVCSSDGFVCSSWLLEYCHIDINDNLCQQSPLLLLMAIFFFSPPLTSMAKECIQTPSIELLPLSSNIFMNELE